jgi:hypothetical protein
LKQVERLATPNLANDDPIWAMTERCFQKVADGNGRQPVLFAAGLESKDIVFLNLYLCRVLNQHNALMVRNEFRQ